MTEIRRRGTVRPPLVRLSRAAILGCAVLWGPAAPGTARAQASITRLWLTEDGDGVVAIEPCDGGALCGWLAGFPDYKPGDKPPLDWRGRPQCGTTFIEVRPASPTLWQGHITDPRDGHVYDAELWVDRYGRLRLRGYIAVPLFGQTQIWTPYDGRTTQDCRLVAGPPRG